MVAACVDSLDIRSRWAGAIVVNKCAIHQSAISPSKPPLQRCKHAGDRRSDVMQLSFTGAERLLALQGRS